MFTKCSVAICLFLVAYLAGWSNSQVPYPEACPNVTTMEVFDLDKYMGVWYDYSKYPAMRQLSKKCQYSFYTKKSNRTITNYQVSVNRFTGQVKTGLYRGRQKAPGQFLFGARTSRQPNYVVLDTDYTSYSVVFSCKALAGVAHSRIALVLTRERQPTNATVEAAMAVFDKNQLPKEFLIKTLHDDQCPDAVKETPKHLRAHQPMRRPRNRTTRRPPRRGT